MRERTLKAIRGTRIEAPKAKCPGCKKSNFHESTRYDALRGKVPVYTCDEPDCKRRFIWRPGFKKRWYGDDTITDALVDAGAGHPPSRIAERMAKGGDGPDERTIRRWIDKYAKIIERFASTLPYRAGERWSLDEKRLKTHPNGSKKKHWWVAVLDEVTGLILGYEVSDTKSGYDATNLLNEIIARVGRVPDVTVADKLNGYRKGFKNAIKGRNPSAVLVADAGIDGRHVNNNVRERLNGEFEDCTGRARGFCALVPGLVRLHALYHNFIHKMGSRGAAPADIAGVLVDGPDRFKTLIQNAALMAA